MKFEDLEPKEMQGIIFCQNKMIMKQNQEILKELRKQQEMQKEIDTDICEGFSSVLNHLGSDLCGIYSDKVTKNKAIRVIGMFASSFDNKARKIKDSMATKHNILDNYCPTMEEKIAVKEMVSVLNESKTKEKVEEILKGLENLFDVLGNNH